MQCDEPAFFWPNHTLQGRYASNSKDNANTRIISEKFELDLYDKFRNMVSLEKNYADKLNGTVRFEIVPLEQRGGDVLVPKFDGDIDHLELPLQNGRCKVAKVMLAAGTCGNHDAVYILRGSPTLTSNPEAKIAPFELKFRFKNEAEREARYNLLKENQNKIFEEQKKIDNKKCAIYKKMQQLKKDAERLDEKRLQLLKKWKREGDTVLKTATLTDICQLKDKKKLELDDFVAKDEQQRSVERPTVAEAPDEPGVLGKVCHLAQLDDFNAAFMLSWHLQSDMDTIVTLTSQKAEELDARFGHKQQLLALEALHRGTLAKDWNAPLPHTRVDSDINVTGNPVLARTLFEFVKDPINSQDVFSSLVGDTILIDTLADALRYRQQVAKYTRCPTIITRDGHRLKSNGVFSGLRNRAPAFISELKRGVFNITPNKKIALLEKTIASLVELQSITEQVEKANAAFRDCQDSCRDELEELDNEFIRLGLECEEMERQYYEEIQRKEQQRLAELNAHNRSRDPRLAGHAQTAVSGQLTNNNVTIKRGVEESTDHETPEEKKRRQSESTERVDEEVM